MNVAWAAGLFEGEGCIGLHGCAKRQDGTKKLYPRMMLAMADKDVVQRFRDIVNCGKLWQRRPQKPHHKPVWMWEVNSKSARQTIDLLYPYLGERRQAKAREVFGDRW